jgi:hypothetical protein
MNFTLNHRYPAVVRACRNLSLGVLAADVFEVLLAAVLEDPAAELGEDVCCMPVSAPEVTRSEAQPMQG